MRKKMFLWLISILMITVLIGSTCFANANNGGSTPVENYREGESTSNQNYQGAAGEINAKGKVILNALSWFGYAIALGMVVFIGIKYITGAADAKANMKSAVTSWLIGAFIVFAATTIVRWVIGASLGGKQNTAEEIVNTGYQFQQTI